MLLIECDERLSPAKLFICKLCRETGRLLQLRNRKCGDPFRIRVLNVSVINMSQLICIKDSRALRKPVRIKDGDELLLGENLFFPFR
ncbi:hypothetical protein D3C71_1484540 [compost metagenome]